MTADYQTVKKLLPQKEPFLFVDEVVFCGLDRIDAKLFLNPQRAFFKGHFPDNPIMPGVLITESMAQTSGLLLSMNSPADRGGKTFYLASANVKFLRVARAGETLDLKARLVKSFCGLFQFEAEAAAAKETVAKGLIVLSEAPQK